MATYPIKMLRDEAGTPFVPLINTEAIVDPDGSTLADKLAHKLEITNIIQGDDVVIAKDADTDTVTISAIIPEIVDNLESSKSTATLSANQGMELNVKINNLQTSLDINVETINRVLENKAAKATTLSGYGIIDAYTKEEVDTKISSVYRYMGSVATEGDLPTENVVIGDVYDVQDTGMNVVWNGTAWDKLGSTVDLSPYLKAADAANLYVTNTTLNTELTNIKTNLNKKLEVSNIKAGDNVIITNSGNNCTIDVIMPVKGVDYWTEEDIAQIEAYCKEYIDAHITDAIGGSY